MSVFASNAVAQTTYWGQEGSLVIEALPSKHWDHSGVFIMFSFLLGRLMTCLQWQGIRSYSHHLGGCHEGEELQTLVCSAVPSRSSECYLEQGILLPQQSFLL